MEWKTVTHRLKYPVVVNGERIEQITLREPDVEALEKIDDLGIEEGKELKVRQLRGIIEAIGDAPDGAIGKLHRADIEALGNLAVPLLVGQGEKEARKAT